MVEDAADIGSCAVCVVDEKTIKRTVKLLIAISNKVKLVKSTWVTACQEKGCLVSEDEYLLKGYFSSDAKSSVTWSFNANKYALDGAGVCFEGLSFLLSANVKPKKEDMKLIIESAGGKVVQRAPETSGAEETWFYAVIQKGDKLSGVSEKNQSVISPEKLLLAVMQQNPALLRSK
ncbi:hypothetical protein T492DRAFT_866582 [Pavlovales sp. CCMP2436]|nr:hypothetical protein T492DRAFT_866582 [Pavlovales sp. CCMP2436]